MKDMQLTQILEKYFAGETSLQEEEWLKKQMEREDLPPKFRKYRALFLYFKQQSALQIPQPKTITQFSRPLKKHLRNYMGIAAATITMILGVYWGSLKFASSPETGGFTYEDTYHTPEEAYEQTQKILSFLSSKMNSGNKHSVNIAKIQTLTSLVNGREKKHKHR